MERLRVIVAVGFVMCWSLLCVGQAQAKKTRAKCQEEYDIRMRSIVSYYDARTRGPKRELAELNNKIAKGKLSKEEQAMYHTWKEKIYKLSKEIAILDQKRADEVKKAQADLNACQSKAKK